MPSLLDRADLRRRVQQVLDDELDRHEATLAAVSPDLVPLVTCARTLLAGGKRLRPAFCYWGWRGAGAADDDHALRAATALELLQAAALLHDDVMDDSVTRRGRPAAHRQFTDLHRQCGWAGDAARFGEAAAILLGDLCLAWSDELFTGSGLPTTRLRRGRPVFDRMRTELMGGQYLDMLEQARGDRVTAGDLPAGVPDSAAERARVVIRYKSAKYTVEHPLQLGGRLADGPEALLAGYAAYGLPLGEAFQLRDDVLGVFGDPAQTGKPAGDDLREGKRTLLVAWATEHATPAQLHVLRQQLGAADLDQAGVDALRGVIVETGALHRVEERIDSLATRSRAALAAMDLDDEPAELLGALVDVATVRTV